MGFLPGKSNQLTVFDIVKDIFHSPNSNLSMGFLFLDVRKAFNCLHHNLLLLKSKRYGFSGAVINCFVGYLDRSQAVRYAGNESKECEFVWGGFHEEQLSSFFI